MWWQERNVQATPWNYFCLICYCELMEVYSRLNKGIFDTVSVELKEKSWSISRGNTAVLTHLVLLGSVKGSKLAPLDIVHQGMPKISLNKQVARSNEKCASPWNIKDSSSMIINSLKCFTTESISIKYSIKKQKWICPSLQWVYPTTFFW